MRSLAEAQYATCGRKKFFHNQQEAEIAADYRTHTEKVKIYTYPCRLCRGWHLTKQPQIGRKKE